MWLCLIVWLCDCVIAWLCYWVNILHAPMRFPAWIYAFRHLRYFNLAYFTKLTFIVWLCVIVWLCDCGIVWLCGCVTGRISSMHKRDSCFEYMLFCNLAKLAKLTIIYVIVWLCDCVIACLCDCVIVMCTSMHFPDPVHQFWHLICWNWSKIAKITCISVLLLIHK